MTVERVESSAVELRIWVRPKADRASCPGCGGRSARVHRRYQRRDWMTDDRARDRPVGLAVNRYLAGTSLIGSVEDCRPVVEAVSAAGVDEIACLVDFVGDGPALLSGLAGISQLANHARVPAGVA